LENYDFTGIVSNHAESTDTIRPRGKELMSSGAYSLQNVVNTLGSTLEQYLEAQYHIWDPHLIRERSRLLRTPGIVAQSPYLEATPTYQLDKPFDQLKLPSAVTELLSIATNEKATGLPKRPYLHQAAALQEFLINRRELLISTGTGSGKTESFLLPILGTLALERLERPNTYKKPAVRALLLYPMNALVGDQLSRLRRLFGNPTVANGLRKADGYCATFGMYTSRTPYPGPATATRNKSRIVEWIHDFFDEYSDQKVRLEQEGKWPAKNLRAFAASLATDKDDRELLSRHEMHSRPPDILVTNYSMLEYMLLRPVEQPLFDKTQSWLESDPKNEFIVVLDEAHLYQGAQGSEVGLLLRRLISRLRIPRSRVRFILTSASLGGDGSEANIRRFAAALTGADANGESFAIIPGTQDRPQGANPAGKQDAQAWAQFDYEALHQSPLDPVRIATALSDLSRSIGDPQVFDNSSVEQLQSQAFEMLMRLPVAADLVCRVMGNPQKLDELAHLLFPDASDPLISMNALIAAGNFAKRVTPEMQRIFLACRLHLLYRGLEGLYACTNPRCTVREETSGITLLGRLYATPRLRCECGARVYELFTHRDCGAAYLRGYTRPGNAGAADFLWHEPSSGRAGRQGVLDAIDLLVETERDHTGDYADRYLHIFTGRLFPRPQTDSPETFIKLRAPGTSAVQINGRPVVTFPKICPVCRSGWKFANAPKIMDLVTKGEAPFAHLIAAQVRIQPASSSASASTPNAGRKSLLFSDGRQKAARLARDLPREIEADAFRQALLVGCQSLRAIRGEACIRNESLYPAFVAATATRHLSFFDGEDANQLLRHQRAFMNANKGDLSDALEEWSYDPPSGFFVNVLRSLGNRNYSLFALALAYLQPRGKAKSQVFERLGKLGIGESDAHALSIVWIQGMLEDFAIYSPTAVRRFTRTRAAGHPLDDDLGSKSGLDATQKKMLKKTLPGPATLDLINAILSEELAEPTTAGVCNLLPGRLNLEIAIDRPWYGCRTCTFLSPVILFGACAHCGSKDVQPWTGGDDYLRARKTFWREPVRQVLAGTAHPITLDVQEHTAQLSFRDTDDLEATTETFERRFRDILLPAKNERAIDVLSCTTTMEVGIDIGSLIGVGLRNIPPSRHNYQQRAGRAGRRGSAVSTVVTYAQNNPHDAFYFDNPRDLISGKPHLLGLDVDNLALVRRHVFAELLQEYFRETVIANDASNVFKSLGDTIAFFTNQNDPSLTSFREWLSNDADEALRRVDAWLPKAVKKTARAIAIEFTQELSAAHATNAQELQSGEEDLIEYLFGRGFLPAYAFPRDLVTLQIERLVDRRPKTEERTQQNASIALSEYAPGRLIVIKKRTYRIGAVTASTPYTEVNRARRLFDNPAVYLQCANCLYTEDPNADRVGQRCPVCQRDDLAMITAIQPECAWPEGARALPEDDDEQMTSDTTVAQLPLPSSEGAFEGRREFGPLSYVQHGRNVDLIMVNRGTETPTGPSGFQVCRDCGHAVADAAKFSVPHERDYLLPTHPPFPSNRLCNGHPERVYLGYRFRTDVLLLTTQLRAPFVFDLDDVALWGPLTDALLSLANSLAIAASTTLGIDVRELQSGYRLTRTANEAKAAIYLYDALAGGAGYSRIAGENFAEVFANAKRLLSHCSNPECRSSCTQCLRSYGNRLVHARLDRTIALDLARYIEAGTAPNAYSIEQQQKLLAPLREMLELEGWKVRDDAQSALIVTKENKSHRLGLVPSLLDSSGLEANGTPAELIFRKYDIERDLPTCLSTVTA
jgi:ATP-dependent helicase YprA (DUF1998 family)